MLLTGIFFSVLTYLAADWLIEWHFIRDARAVPGTAPAGAHHHICDSQP